MIRHLTRQFGLLGFGLCVLCSFVIWDARMDEMESRMEAASAYSATVNHLAGAINASQLQPARFVKLPAKPAVIRVAALVKK